MKSPTLSKHHVRIWHHIRIRRRHRDTRLKFFERALAANIHLGGCFLSLIGMGVLIGFSSINEPLAFFGALLYSTCAVVLFGASGIMHLLSEGFRISSRFAKILENFDRFAIHFLIAGTYSAVVLKALPYPRSIYLICMMWTCALLGVAYTAFKKYFPAFLQSRFISTGQYLLLSWVGVAFLPEIFTNLPAIQVFFCGLGGLFYTVGAIIYMLEKPNISRVFGYHELWHLLVVFGNFSFFTMILFFYI